MLNRVYLYIVREMDAEQREKFEGELYAPVTGDLSESDLLSALDRAALGVTDDD